MSLLRRTMTDARSAANPGPAPQSVPRPPAGAAELRGQVDPDPLVEQATDRLRDALTTLDAHDEWGRQLAWRQVARIAIGPLLTELRDAQTAVRLMTAAQTAADAAAAATATDQAPTPPGVELELFAEAGDATSDRFSGNGWPSRPTM
jgi:hypothetical protein